MIQCRQLQVSPAWEDYLPSSRKPDTPSFAPLPPNLECGDQAPVEEAAFPPQTPLRPAMVLSKRVPPGPLPTGHLCPRKVWEPLQRPGDSPCTSGSRASRALATSQQTLGADCTGRSEPFASGDSSNSPTTEAGAALSDTQRGTRGHREGREWSGLTQAATGTQAARPVCALGLRAGCPSKGGGVSRL